MSGSVTVILGTLEEAGLEGDTLSNAEYGVHTAASLDAAREWKCMICFYEDPFGEIRRRPGMGMPRNQVRNGKQGRIDLALSARVEQGGEHGGEPSPAIRSLHDSVSA